MCANFLLMSEEQEQEMLDILAEIDRRYKDKPALEALKLGSIFPKATIPVIANSKKEQQPEPYLMRWGFSHWDGTNGVIFNTRSEGADTKPMFKQSMQERRCIIPANSYFEWDKRNPEKKERLSFKPEGQNMIYMAGIYRIEKDLPLAVCSILTKKAADHIKDIHDRMPVILSKHDITEWLTPGADYNGVIARAQENMKYVAA